MSKENLSKFIRTMAEDPETRKKFESDPEAVMESHDLSDEHKDLIRSGDKKALQDEAGAEDAHMNFIVL
ncbi:Nif11 family protein [Wenzhouxiangella sp. XN79A]|uniref:Nif11 family protein n=1 Tax=Wenzhouxiangella sp. XN79A TaxID=2724193 RepID=UPI00144AEF41|nr:Nif11 family protein [Wenzhouxiangella sp. XN79A]NKI36536.1 Nif11 family protein [Wenzhouxiangella sp. XN79A]